MCTSSPQITMEKKITKKYIGKIGKISYGGITIQVKVIDYKELGGREHVLITPLKNGKGEIWKYAKNIDFS